ncbi:hypothetical protein M1P56_23985 [Streptomyces sp. HU2014]|uniref:Type A2 lantipeptide n=1 Tax=Streptomyces albireticuli TaxID=1940 RepID=A0A1Z2KYJ1_9ACTN|nr:MULTISPECIES: hypothetical protein [Streptomyces]ARZ67113.1 hypothetical protein SMD11_1452 [Streptomyces albireticuli]UQI47184.1 hypothetical protein M1P56_23985 [Streptomyces sp. HU2014]
MRNNIETREIADTELDAVSGGVAGVSGGLAGAVTGDVHHLVDSLQTIHAVQALPGQVTGIAGVHVGAAGL